MTQEEVVALKEKQPLYRYGGVMMGRLRVQKWTVLEKYTGLGVTVRNKEGSVIFIEPEHYPQWYTQEPPLKTVKQKGIGCR